MKGDPGATSRGACRDVAVEYDWRAYWRSGFYSTDQTQPEPSKVSQQRDAAQRNDSRRNASEIALGSRTPFTLSDLTLAVGKHTARKASVHINVRLAPGERR